MGAAYDAFGRGSASLYVIINGVTNSPTHKPWEVLYRANSFSTATPLRNIINQVKPPGIAVPPKLKAARNGDAVDLTLTGENGRTYRIEASANLVNWTKVGQVNGSTAGVVYRDAEASTIAQRFYRAVQE
ncbi:MAG: hypothetical protein FJ403_22625 [Verrucomicrobia bacterium]|nr:hypothetical protein [Verrucomicrobiota bacterium]